jgi:hypothetical protein
MNDQQLNEIFNSFKLPKELFGIDPKCTCRDDMKRRPLCPVCDKEEYDKSRSQDLNALKSKL